MIRDAAPFAAARNLAVDAAEFLGEPPFSWWVTP